MVLKTWRDAFDGLFNADSGEFNDQFKENKLKEEINLKLEHDDLNQLITIEEIRMLVMKAKKKKAVGTDLIPNELLKDEQVVTMLTKLCDYCLEFGVIPDNWRTAIINPIPKERTQHIDPLKSRGISLLCCMYKILSGVVNWRLTKHLERNKLLADEQNGFRKNRSCHHHLYYLVNSIKQEIG